METLNKTAIVIGAGLVGCSCALWLQRKGFSVTLIDPKQPGTATSFGNACTIAEYGCVPVNSPGLFRQLPKLLLSADSPLQLDLGYALANPRWMLSFLKHCRGREVDRIISLLGGLLAKTYAGLDPLLDMASARDLLCQQDFIHVYENQQQFDAAKPANQARRDQGADFIELDAAAIKKLEPGLKKSFQHGLLFNGISHLLNPQQLCQRYVDCLQQNQGQWLQHKVIEVEHDSDSVKVKLDNQQTVTAQRLVVAAGAWSKTIDGLRMRQIPLDTERGYHIQYSNLQHLVNRPVSWHHAGFYATPMNQGLRLAGTVEIAGLDKPANPRMIDYLTRKANQMFELSQPPDQEWLGFRPTCPDALPVIGFSTDSEQILFAFGHHHLGLTLSGITGKLIAELANGEKPSHNIAPFSPQRFE